MDVTAFDKEMMRRALQLARCGESGASPNPMVGAVVVCDGRIIGEGYHRRCGGPHAEVNAIASVADPRLLPQSTIYVTLEPCAHFGRTPPCADLIVDKGLKRVVVGCLDPFAKVDGRGVERIRRAGIEVVTGVLREECEALNVKFFTAHRQHRPYTLLKWATSADGYMASRGGAVKFSTPLTMQLMHGLRARYDAIMVGAGTVVADNPSLTVRGIAGNNPARVVLDAEGVTDSRAAVYGPGRVICITGRHRSDLPDHVEQQTDVDSRDMGAVMRRLYDLGFISLMVEGGARVLAAVTGSGLWDEVRIEVAPVRLGSDGLCRQPAPEGVLKRSETLDGNMISEYSRL
ncbi:MAG: bifunctional diaminohydroxyphosphoribosylaminopyrimidine deaminase/5-amino-6-(5-phosphoribosylamino)uracil reductase RibD [Paramuribaculum sp.]|nr:bifunctional diaminohydroxyphosphoribosylaminopyrimidine deaminase/5-amino-6-(5-phosphoribosylamino)uracil reductase RibD [Paramuribaculum sp.]